MNISYEDLRTLLEGEGLELLREMTDLHLAAGSGTRSFVFSQTFGGTSLHFASSEIRQSLANVDTGALTNLAVYGLLHQDDTSRRTPRYRLSADGLAFCRWLRQQDGRAIDQVQASILRLVDSRQFATAHPTVSRLLNEAFELLWSDRSDKLWISEIGDHLRKALMDIVYDLGDNTDTTPEQPVVRLKQHLRSLPHLHQRERKVLEQTIDLTQAVINLDHRLAHVRDEEHKGEGVPTHREVRRAAFLTAVTCYELSELFHDR